MLLDIFSLFGLFYEVGDGAFYVESDLSSGLSEDLFPVVTVRRGRMGVYLDPADLLSSTDPAGRELVTSLCCSSVLWCRMPGVALDRATACVAAAALNSPDPDSVPFRL